MPNPLRVLVTVTQTGNSLSITVSDPVLAVPRQANAPSETPILWALDPASSAGAQITNITFPWPAPAVNGYTFTQWPGPDPTGQPNGQWIVTCRNDNPGPGHVYFEYNVYASVGSTTGELDPIVDNQPPPMKVPHPSPKPQNP